MLKLTDNYHLTEQTTLRYDPPEEFDGKEVKLRAYQNEIEVTLKELLALLQSIDSENTPINHLLKYEINGEYSKPDNYNLEFDPDYGLYRVIDDGEKTNIVFNSNILRRTIGFLANNIVDTEDIKKQIIETERKCEFREKRESINPTLYFSSPNRDHILRGGETLCHHNVKVGDPTGEQVVPASEMPDGRLAYFIHSDLCAKCRSIARKQNLLEDHTKEDMEGPKCPITGEKPERIRHSFRYGTALEFRNDTHQEVTPESFEDWRRGKRDDLEPVDRS